MKKLFVLAFVLVGCGQNPTVAPKPKPKPPKTEPVKTAPVVIEPVKSAPVASAPASEPEPVYEPVVDLVSTVTANGVEEPQGMDWGDKGKDLASTNFKNADVLATISGNRFMAAMQSMSANLGGDCGLCHEEDFSSDKKKPKVTARKMMEMATAIDHDYFENKVKVSCYTCHRGYEEPSKVPVAAPTSGPANPPPPPPKTPPTTGPTPPKNDGMSEEDKKKPSGEFFKNVQILKTVPAGDLVSIMKSFNAALGVKCNFCHVKEKFDSDDKPEKVRARDMLKMATAINETYFPGKKMAVTCNTCHQGSNSPAVNVGPTFVVTATVTGQATWNAIFGIAKWPTIPKTRGEFGAQLEPIPANQGLAGGFSNTDTGEMGHLPPGDYNLCGFARPAKPEDDKLKGERPVTCQPVTITATPTKQTAKIEVPAP